MHEDSLNLLQSLGFSSYEAKAYTGILRSQPVGAYELAKRSGVPSSKIYETLNKLLKRDIVQFAADDPDQNPTYIALPAEDLINRLNQEVSQKTQALLPMLQNLADKHTPDFIWPIQDSEQLKDRARGIIQSAQKSLLLSCWAEELAWLQNDLEQAEARGIPIALVHFGQTEHQIGATYQHPVERTLYAEKGGRGLTLVADSAEVLLANISASGFDACWSRNAAFVTVAEDYIKHDVYITKVTKHLNPEMLGRYGTNYEKLRNIFDAEA